MNEYKISFSMFLVVDGKISTKNHFSNCRDNITGDSFEEAVESFKAEKRKEGWELGFITEGDVFKIEFFDLK